MAEEAPIVAAPEPAPVLHGQDQPGGSASLAADMDKLFNPPKDEVPAEEPAGDPKKPAGDLPLQPPDKPIVNKPAVAPKKEAPKAPEKPKPAIEPVKEKDPVALRTQLAKQNAKVDELQAKLDDMGKRGGMTSEKKEDYDRLQERIKSVEENASKTRAELEQRNKSLEADIYSRDFRESPEFKQKYYDRWQKTYQDAKEEVLSMQVQDAEGNQRNATESDLNRVLSAPKALQRKVAKEIFGEDADVVLGHRNSLKSIEDAGNEEIENRRKGYDETRQKQQETFKQYGSVYERAHADVDKALVEKYPEYFGEVPDSPEETKQLQVGLKFVDDALAGAASATPEDRAKNNAIIRRWAGSAPRMIHVIKSLKQKLADQEVELGKYRRSEPGSESDSPGTEEQQSDEPQNTDALVAMLGKPMK